jgi:hypothetical protein
MHKLAKFVKLNPKRPENVDQAAAVADPRPAKQHLIGRKTQQSVRDFVGMPYTICIVKCGIWQSVRHAH